MPSNHLILYHPLLLQPSIFPSIRVFSNESVLRIRWPKYWSFSFSISPSNEHSGLISLRMDWLDVLAVQGTLKRLIQHHSSKASVLQHSAFFMVQLTHSLIDIIIFIIIGLLDNLLSALLKAHAVFSLGLLANFNGKFLAKYSPLTCIMSQGRTLNTTKGRLESIEKYPSFSWNDA